MLHSLSGDISPVIKFHDDHIDNEYAFGSFRFLQFYLEGLDLGCAEKQHLVTTATGPTPQAVFSVICIYFLMQRLENEKSPQQ
ncbi:hypothetical protein A6X21_01590 [Planctopirus hydrillae]|uniref:Uncharacterized protein n=1 Tax=Planctopirus hydrillae TaxID=1841610 RepID=A0A1C3EU16_9PLAN|nr:hypothetical protein A6X21_01590 [Planctopirus hydrillae]